MKYLIYIFLLISLNTFSNTLDIGKYNQINKTVVDYLKKELYVFSKDSLTIIDLTKLKKISKIKITYTDDENSIGYPICINSKIYFIHLQGGIVHLLKENKIIRIDNSFNHKMQIDSFIFQYNNKIYRYGGYGFWSERNFFTCFNPKNLEWEIIPPTGSQNLPVGSHNSKIIVQENDFYVYGGETIKDNNPLEGITNDKVWRFNIQKKKWVEMGIMKIDINRFESFISYEGKHVYVDTKHDLIYELDVVNNKIKTYKSTSINRQLSSLKETFYIDGLFYSFKWKPFTSNTEVQIITSNKDNFFGEFISEEPLYDTPFTIHDLFNLIFIIVLISLSVIFYLIINKRLLNRKKINLVNEDFIFNSKPIVLDEISNKILTLLLKSDKDILSKDIIDIVENPNLNYGHNKRVMNEYIDKINYKLKIILKIESDIITQKKSSLDKRIKEYSINKSYFHIK
jgi:hypothetical protein